MTRSKQINVSVNVLLKTCIELIENEKILNKNVASSQYSVVKMC